MVSSFYSKHLKNTADSQMITSAKTSPKTPRAFALNKLTGEATTTLNGTTSSLILIHLLLLPETIIPRWSRTFAKQIQIPYTQRNNWLEDLCSLTCDFHIYTDTVPLTKAPASLSLVVTLRICRYIFFLKKADRFKNT